VVNHSATTVQVPGVDGIDLLGADVGDGVLTLDPNGVAVLEVAR